MSTIIKYGSSNAWLTYNGNVLNANATTIPPLTYRFRFESPQTAADLAGVGLRGSWNRVSDYLWDFTCNSNDPWSYNFYYGHDGNGMLPACHLVGTSTTASDTIHLAFWGQVNLKSAYIPVAQLTDPFNGCTSLTSFQMDNFAGGDQQLHLPYAETIEFGVFNGWQLEAASCTSLHIGSLPGSAYDAQNLSYVGSAQSPCSIIIDSMPNATSISTMFQGGVGIGSIYLGHTDSLTNCSQAFKGCSHLTQIHIDNTRSVTTTWQMFQDCEWLPSCPAFDLRSCTDMHYMFDGCTALSSCPDFPVTNDLLGSAGYQAVQRMYSNCTGLTGGAFDWYYTLTGDTEAYRAAYGHLPPDPDYQGPFNSSDDTDTFYGAQSTEVGWEYIPDNSWR
jgi:hypothetical protein